MAKIDINACIYNKLWAKDGSKVLQSLLDQSDIFFTNYGWWKTQGSVSPEFIPTDAHGVAAFSCYNRKAEAAPLMDWRAPLADTNQLDGPGEQKYTATIPDFSAPGWVEKATERKQRMDLIEQLGNDSDILGRWKLKLQTQLDSAFATLNNMTAQLITTGGIDWSKIGRGIHGVMMSNIIPKENFIKAGEKAWTDPTCKILSQMQKIEEDYRTKRGATEIPLVWQMTRKTFFNVFLQNAEVKELVMDYRKLHYIASTEGMRITEDEFRQAFTDFQGISPIEIVVERERNKTNSGDGFINGWDDNKVVLRPAGDAVEFVHTNVLDREMDANFSNNLIESVYGSYERGLITVRNSIVPDGRFKEWHTDVLMSACPALIHFIDNVVVDISQAA
jgi:hypothetical protein